MKINFNSFFSRLLITNTIIVLITIIIISGIFGYLIQNYYYGLREWKASKDGHRIAEIINNYINDANLKKFRQDESLLRINTISKTSELEIGIINNHGDFILNSSNFDSLKMEIEDKTLKEVIAGNQVINKIKGPKKNELLMIFPLFKDPLNENKDISLNTKGNSDIIGGIILKSELDSVKTTIIDILKLIFYSSLIALIIALLLSIRFSQNIVKPLNKVKASAKNISNNEFTKIKENNVKTTELKNLIETYNYAVEEIEKTIKKKNRLEKLRKEYIANISHEFRTPLSSIKGFAEIIEEQDLNQTQLKNYSSIMKNEAEHLQYLVEELLILGQLDSDGIKLNIKRVKLKDLISFAVNSLETEINKKNIKIKGNYENNNLEIKVDPNKFKEVFINLIDNAVKHSPENSKIEIITQKINNPKNEIENVKIMIKDEGKGIEEEKQDKVWERFYKVDESRSRNDSNGTGLGLAIVKDIIDKHQAEVNIQNNKQGGASFIVTLNKKHLVKG
ncbi:MULTISPECIES: sensor histidine kinase [Halanaerobium]|uniref:histidine kinase n=1 Tax=Halanaerobium kushneri TaxID=56779 RepID=A0A1N6UUW4_9FIRM|nr:MULTISPECIES: ATP-binding protein [Halanaerobium]RCW50590.1 HAMP domain-containing protein [Halanaerobium sp. ST460_2HS_T2]SIQ69016.1 HAMP domain-containing protein [Halanaerobium kushneri]